VDGAAADHGAEDPNLGVLRGRYFGEVVGKNDEIGVFADLKLALLPFLKLRISGARGVGSHAIFERDFLLRLPAVPRPAFRTLARHAGIQPAERADGLYGIVGSERKGTPFLSIVFQAYAPVMRSEPMRFSARRMSVV